MSYILSYLATIASFLALDALWILFLAKQFYAEQLGFLFSKQVNLSPVAFFYPAYALAVLLLAAVPAASSASWIEALWRGALLGVAAYGAYDLTNHATIANWPSSVTFVDMAWGIAVTATVSLVAYLVLVAMK